MPKLALAGKPEPVLVKYLSLAADTVKLLYSMKTD